MNVFEFLTDFFKKLFIGKPNRPAADNPEAGAGSSQAGLGGLETRCVNPDMGCPFEVS
jgi:hypothetical protein